MQGATQCNSLRIPIPRCPEFLPNLVETLCIGGTGILATSTSRSTIVPQRCSSPRPILLDGAAGVGDVKLHQTVNHVSATVQLQPVDRLTLKPRNATI